mmetsp:Transcript_23542/g.65269  ORF Transcript_23542/g.65269 Transcript_23542/m.65269 type:complete len:278 (-) Transcript_23542:536-1369(-)
MFGADVVALGDDKEGGDLEGQCHTKVLLAHANQACVCPHHHASVVWHVAGEAVGGGAEVALVASEVHKGDNLAGFCNIFPTVGGAEHRVVEDFPVLIQAKVVLPHARGSTGALLMAMLENLGAGKAPSVIEDGAGEDADKGALAAVDVPNDSNADLERLPGGGPLPHEDVGPATADLLMGANDCGRCVPLGGCSADALHHLIQHGLVQRQGRPEAVLPATHLHKVLAHALHLFLSNLEGVGQLRLKHVLWALPLWVAEVEDRHQAVANVVHFRLSHG